MQTYKLDRPWSVVSQDLSRQKEIETSQDGCGASAELGQLVQLGIWMGGTALVDGY